VRKLTDAEKIARGTLDERTSETARAKREIGKILAFPVLKEIPAPTFPLNEVGTKTYQFWANRLLDTGLLTQVSLGHIENLAMTEDIIASNLKSGERPAVNLLEARRKSLQWLETLNVDTTVFAGEAQKGAFSSHGFPGRLRAPSEHLARRSRPE
jgi:hypothetical protein